MSDRINLLKRVSSLDKSPTFDSYSKVLIHIDDETDVEVGNDYGRTLEFTNPFGSETMATQLLAKLSGFQYQPFSAVGALLDPAAEIGDGISVKNLYSGLYTRDREFTRLMKADISAPHDEEINHEYKYETSTERKFKRRVGEVRASLIVQANMIAAEVEERTAQDEVLSSQLSVQAEEIEARVSKTGGDNSSFGWSLLSNEFALYSGNTKVFWVNSSGANVKGTITATSGKIGGFTIGSNAIYNNISAYGGTQSTGVYLGINGIQLGQNFKVDTAGNVTANNMRLSGTLNVGGSNISASVLRTGAQQAYNGYGGWNATSSTVSSNAPTWSSGAYKGSHAYSRAASAWIGDYRLTFGTGITILGSEFEDSNGERCSGTARRSNVVTCSYAGGYD